MSILAEIWANSDIAEVFFLIAVICFALEALRLLAAERGPATWGYHWLLVVLGLTFCALGWLALPTGG